MNSKDGHQHTKISHHLFEKLSNKITAIKEDLTEAVKERSRSFSADRHGLVSSTNSLPITNSVTFSLQDDQQLIKPSGRINPMKNRIILLRVLNVICQTDLRQIRTC